MLKYLGKRFKVEGLGERQKSCKGQELIVRLRDYSKIMLLCCAEWGNFAENIIIRYQGGFMEKNAIEYPDWDIRNTSSPEVIAWTGSNIKTGNYKSNGNIYA